MTIRFATSLPVALRRPNLASLVVAFSLAACGGGGGSDSSNSQPEPSPPPVVPNPPPPSPPPVVSKGDVSLLAGTTAGFGNLDGTGAAARFNGPSGLTVGPAGELYVADIRSQRIRKITSAGVVSTVAGSGQPGNADGPGQSATFWYPRDVAVDPSGNVFVATDAVVRKITPDGAVTTVAGVGTARYGVFQGDVDPSKSPRIPRAVAVDALGIAYIADAFAGAVYTLTPTGTLTVLAGSVDREQQRPDLRFPSGIALDAARNVYVADISNRSIARITQSGQLTTLVPASPALGYPAAIAADAAGNLFLADSEHHVVRQVTAAGAVSVLAGVPDQPGGIDGPPGMARFDTPQGIAVGSDGTLFVSDGPNTVRKIDLLGNVSTLAGLAAPRGSNFGEYHATDPAGNVYLAVQVTANPADYAIQRIAPDGTATTLLNSGLQSPRGMALDITGNLYVVDAPKPQVSQCIDCGVNTVVRKITPQGGMTILAGTLSPTSISDVDGTGSAAAFRSAHSLAIDAAGNLYVGQIGGALLRKITPDGVVTTIRFPAGPPYPANPRGLAVDASGNVYLAACYTTPPRFDPSGPAGAAVLKLDTGGRLTLLAGSQTQQGYRDGPGAQALFSSELTMRAVCTGGIALDAAGNVYLADTGNDAVRKITPDGVVSTVVGQPGKRGISLGSLPATLAAPTDVSFDDKGHLIIGSLNALLKVQLD